MGLANHERCDRGNSTLEEGEIRPYFFTDEAVDALGDQVEEEIGRLSIPMPPSRKMTRQDPDGSPRERPSMLIKEYAVWRAMMRQWHEFQVVFQQAGEFAVMDWRERQGVNWSCGGKQGEFGVADQDSKKSFNCVYTGSRCGCFVFSDLTGI